MMRQVPAMSAAFALAAFALSACETNPNRMAKRQANPAPCPNIFALDDAARMIDFAGEPALETVAWSAEIVEVRTNCRYYGDVPIKATVEIDFAVGRGPAAVTDTTEVRYFVAVTRTDRAMIAKEEYVVPVRVKNGIATTSFTQEIEDITIARASEETSGSNFEIAVGFALTRDQILFNRSGASLKFPNL